MLVLLTGGSGSGKSEFAEKTASDFGGKMLYVATMKPYDDECVKRIERHRKMRDGKGFATLECYGELTAIHDTADTIMLECVSNLLSNIMYGENGINDNAVENVIRGIEHLITRCKNLVIVTNEISSDGIEYDTDTLKYMKNLGMINCKIAEIADKVYEVVYGIATEIK